MKRFWLFSGYDYYPDGGMNDFEGSFDSFEEAEGSIKPVRDWSQIFDTATGKTAVLKPTERFDDDSKPVITSTFEVNI